MNEIKLVKHKENQLSTPEPEIIKVKILMKILRLGKIAQGIVNLKKALFRQNEKFWTEFEKELKNNRRTTSKYRVSLTLETFQEWKKEWTQMAPYQNQTPLSNNQLLTELSEWKEELKSELRKEIRGELQKEIKTALASYLPQSSPNSLPPPQIHQNSPNSFGTFVYDPNHITLAYQTKPCKYWFESKRGLNWFKFSDNQIKISLGLAPREENKFVVYGSIVKNGVRKEYWTHFPANSDEKVIFTLTSEHEY